MRDELTIRIAGEAGQGIETIGSALCKTFKSCGLRIFANQDYMSRVRGGNNFFQIRVARNDLFTLRGKADIVVALDKNSIDLHRASLVSGGIMVLDREKFKIAEKCSSYFDVPLYKIALEAGGNEIFINSVAYGVIAGLVGIDPTLVEEVIKDIFSEKADDVITKNTKAVKAGYGFVKNNFTKKDFRLEAPSEPKNTKLLMNGNEAIALGAIRAGCKFYSAYPMTPSTNIMNTIAEYAARFNILVEQAEDEIAAVNMIIGASFAGARSMAATSGGGFALMVEGLSLAAMTETPVVIVDAQRPAPATGFPTRTEQADFSFLIHAGHGEFARVVYAPGSIEEAFYLTVRAFNMAEKYQIPVLVMTDQHLADSYRDIDKFDLARSKVERYIISKSDSAKVEAYKRYQFTDSGISPRAIPSWIPDVIYVDSDEHTEEGHITEDAGIRRKMVEKRFYKKMENLKKETAEPTTYNLKGADVALIGFGSTLGVMKEASDAFKARKTGFVHFSQVWPLSTSGIEKTLAAAKKIFTVENNAEGQFAKLLKRETGIKVNASILKFDGRPFDLDYLLKQLEEVSKR